MLGYKGSRRDSEGYLVDGSWHIAELYIHPSLEILQQLHFEDQKPLRAPHYPQKLKAVRRESFKVLEKAQFFSGTCIYKEMKFFHTSL